MADKHHDVIEDAEATELNADFNAIEHASTISDANHEGMRSAISAFVDCS